MADATFTPLTNWDGAEEGAEISPDGKFVAFLSDHEGEFDVWLTQLGSGIFSNLTQAVPPLAASGSIVRKLGFSGDGSEIWFNPGDRQPLLLMPLTGGATARLPGKRANTPAWSADGRRLAFFTNRSRVTIRWSLPIKTAPTRPRSPCRDPESAAKLRRVAQQQPGVVTRRPVDLLRQRARAAERDERGHLAGSTIRRSTGATRRTSMRP